MISLKMAEKEMMDLYNNDLHKQERELKNLMDLLLAQMNRYEETIKRKAWHTEYYRQRRKEGQSVPDATKIANESIGILN